MIELQKLYLRNFRSYGDYDTEISIDNLGPVLISGEVVGSTNSNGAGKSSLVDAIIWCLFGRLPSKDRPADSVVNTSVGKNCMVRLTTKDGYIIERTRKMEGHSDLCIKTTTGEDKTDSVNQNAQKHLNRLFNLDYYTFMSTVFFAQFGQPIMMLTEIKRRKTLERMLGMGKNDYYAESAKEKAIAAEKEQQKYIAESEQLNKECLRIGNQIETHRKYLEDWETKREQNIKEKLESLNGLEDRYKQKQIDLLDKMRAAKEDLGNINTYDIQLIRNSWVEHEKRQKIAAKLANDLETMSVEANKLALLKERLEATVYVDLTPKIKEKKKKLKELIDELNALVSIDIGKLKEEWDVYTKTKIMLQDNLDACNNELNNIANAHSKIEELEGEIKTIKGNVGKTCIECEQDISDEHVKKQMVKRDTKIGGLRSLIQKCNNRIAVLNAEAGGVVNSQPVYSIREAGLINSQVTDKESEVEGVVNDIRALQHENSGVADKEAGRVKRLESLRSELQNAVDEIDQGKLSLKSRLAKIDELRPSITVGEAEATLEQYRAKQGEIDAVNDQILIIDQQKKAEKVKINMSVESLRGEVNPFDKAICGLTDDFNRVKKEYVEAKQLVTKFDTLIRHVNYIRKSYSDRKMIKAFTARRLVPLLNEKIAYYLGALDCDFKIEFNEFLQAETGSYPYELWSGGERRRIDIALMFAIHRLNCSIHELQSNLLVFDEVERSLDKAGVNDLVELINREYSEKTVLIISHTDGLQDAFPTKILVRRTDRHQSTIEEVR